MRTDTASHMVEVGRLVRLEEVFVHTSMALHALVEGYLAHVSRLLSLAVLSCEGCALSCRITSRALCFVAEFAALGGGPPLACSSW